MGWPDDQFQNHNITTSRKMNSKNPPVTLYRPARVNPGLRRCMSSAANRAINASTSPLPMCAAVGALAALRAAVSAFAGWGGAPILDLSDDPGAAAVAGPVLELTASSSVTRCWRSRSGILLIASALSAHRL